MSSKKPPPNSPFPPSSSSVLTKRKGLLNISMHNRTVPQFNETEWEILLSEIFGNDEVSKLVIDLRRLGVNMADAGRYYKSLGINLPLHKALWKFREYVRTHGVRVSELFTESSDIDLRADQAWKDRRRLQGRAIDLDSYQDRIQYLL